MVAFAILNEGYDHIGKDTDGIKVTVWTVRDAIQQAEFARIHAEKTVELMREIAKLDYASIKMNLIAVPRVTQSIKEKRWGPMIYL